MMYNGPVDAEMRPLALGGTSFENVDTCDILEQRWQFFLPKDATDGPKPLVGQSLFDRFQDASNKAFSADERTDEWMNKTSLIDVKTQI